MGRQEAGDPTRRPEGARPKDPGRHHHRGPRLILYLDASALIKLLVTEPGRQEVVSATEEADRLASCRIAYAESRSALARAQADGRLTPHAYTAGRENLEVVWGRLAVLEVDRIAVVRAGDLADRHLLRGMDAIHLAAAVELAARAGEPVRFASWDTRLRAAARAERLRTVPA